MKKDSKLCAMCEDEIISLPNYKLISSNWLHRLWNSLISPNWLLKKYTKNKYGQLIILDLNICADCASEMYENILARRTVEEAEKELLKGS